MKGRHGLQAKMTATYVAVTAGAVLLTELVIFGVAALSPPTPLTPQEVQGLAQVTTAGLAPKLANIVGKAGHLRGTDLSTTGTPVPLGQARPDGSGGVAIPQITTPGCDLAAASFAVVVDRSHTAPRPHIRRATKWVARAPPRRKARRGRCWRHPYAGRSRTADKHHCRPATSCGRSRRSS